MIPSTAYITLYTSILLLGLNGLFSNGLPLDATTLTHTRSIFAAMTLIVFIYVTKGRFRLPNKKSILIVYGLGILMGLHWVTFFYAMQSASVAIGMLALYTFPIMTIFIEPFFTKKKVRFLDIMLGLLVLSGLFIIVSDHLSTSSHSVFIGVISGIISAIFFSLRNVIQKYRCPDISSQSLMLHQMITIAVMLLLFTNTQSLLALNIAQWFYVLLLGVITTAIAHTLLVKSYKVFAAKTVAMVSCLQPVFGAFFAWLILNESLTLSTVIGGGIILGVAVYESTKAPV